jgi:hypothetical protein
LQNKIAFSLLTAVLVASAIACGGEVEPDETTDETTPADETGTAQQDLAIGGLNAKGDSCTIDTPEGLKIPGTEDGNGKCCSVFDATKCVDLPKKDAAYIGRIYTRR